MSRSSSSALRSSAFLALILLATGTAAAQLEAPRQFVRADEQAMFQLADEIPGFGGLYYDEAGYPHVYLTDPDSLAAQAKLPAEAQVLRADFELRALAEYRDQIVALMGNPSIAWVDLDEKANRVRVALDRNQSLEAKASFEGELASLLIPREAVIIDRVEPIRQLVTLRESVRPIPGGMQINFGGFLCTLGLGVTRAGVVGFVTNSHCTNTQGGVESTVYHQPAATARIGVEIADPTYFTGGQCPAGRRCRFSDSSFARYDSSTLRQFARVARTTGINSLTISTTSPRFVIIGEQAFPSAGQTLVKIGRTTGWTQGTVSTTCAAINVSGTNITQLCQDLVNAGVGGGDSGSPVILRSGTTNAIWAGLLWGGGGGSFAMSAVSNIESELGALTSF